MGLTIVYVSCDRDGLARPSVIGGVRCRHGDVLLRLRLAFHQRRINKIIAEVSKGRKLDRNFQNGSYSVPHFPNINPTSAAFSSLASLIKFCHVFREPDNSDRRTLRPPALQP